MYSIQRDLCNGIITNNLTIELVIKFIFLMVKMVLYQSTLREQPWKNLSMDFVDLQIDYIFI